MCRRCLTVARCDEARNRRRNEECKGASLAVASVIDNPQQHVLATAKDQDGSAMIFCIKCGSYATTNPKSLKKPCRGRCQFQSAGHHNLMRISEGMRPAFYSKSKLQDVVLVDAAAKLHAKTAINAMLATMQPKSR